MATSNSDECEASYQAEGLPRANVAVYLHGTSDTNSKKQSGKWQNKGLLALNINILNSCEGSQLASWFSIEIILDLCTTWFLFVPDLENTGKAFQSFQAQR